MNEKIYIFYRPSKKQFVKKSDPKQEALDKLKNTGPVAQQKVRTIKNNSPNNN